MRNIKYLFLLLIASVFVSCNSDTVRRKAKKVLIVTEASRMLNPANTLFLNRFINLANEGTFLLDTAMSSRPIKEGVLEKYSAIVLLDVFEENLQPAQHSVLEKYLEAGGGMMVVDRPNLAYSAWPLYSKLINDSSAWTDEAQFYRQQNLGAGRAVVFRLEKWKSYSLEIMTGDVTKQVLFLMGDNTYKVMSAPEPVGQ